MNYRHRFNSLQFTSIQILLFIKGYHNLKQNLISIHSYRSDLRKVISLKIGIFAKGDPNLKLCLQFLFALPFVDKIFRVCLKT